MNKRYRPYEGAIPVTDEQLPIKKAAKTPVKKVIIEVRGGVAYAVRVPRGVQVEIIDHDNIEGC